MRPLRHLCPERPVLRMTVRPDDLCISAQDAMIAPGAWEFILKPGYHLLER
jgi:hypothetical protein